MIDYAVKMRSVMKEKENCQDILMHTITNGVTEKAGRKLCLVFKKLYSNLSSLIPAVAPKQSGVW